MKMHMRSVEERENAMSSQVEQHALDGMRASGNDLPAPGPRRPTVILPPQRWVSLPISELWEYRELLYFLVWRDIKVRYKQTVLGAAWAIIQPLFTMVVFSIFFGRLAGISSEGVPYPIFSYSALVPWMYFSNAVHQASNSLVASEQMITKVYFPRLLVPIAAVLAGLLDFVIAFTVLVGMMLYFGVALTPAIWTFPLFLLLLIATAMGVGLWLSALNVRYRDVRYAVVFLIQFWLFATPIAYPSSLVPERWRAIYGLNPMAGVVEGFRWSLLGQAPGLGVLLAASVPVVVGVLLSALYYFQRMEQTFADVV
jgi:lipopolysaccharide transport system permease protein